MNAVAPHDQFRAGSAPDSLPASSANEQAFLGALLVNNDVLLQASDLRSEHFFEEAHRRTFDVIKSMIASGKVANAITIRPLLGEQDVGGMTLGAYVARLYSEAGPPLAAATHAEVIIALHGRRRLAEIAEQARRAAFDPPPAASVGDLIDAVEEDLAALRASAPGETVTRGTAGEFATELLVVAEERRLGTATESRATSTGIPDLDRDTGGLIGGLLWIIGGRPGMGKTLMGTNLARAAAAHGTGTLMFSLEVPRHQITARFLSDIIYQPSRPLPFGDIEHGRYGDDDAERIAHGARRLSEMPLVLDCIDGLSLTQITARVRAEKLRMARLGVRLGVVVIDYLKMVKGTDRYTGQRHYEVGEISIGLKQLAKREDVCVILLAQVNRETEKRQDHRPDLADLRESGDLEADADVVGFIYRELDYIERSPEYRRHDAEAVERAITVKHDLELIIAKNRAGRKGTHELWIDVGCSKISARTLQGH